MHPLRFSILLLIAFFFITFPAYSSLLHSGMPTSHDGEGHIIRMFEFNNAINDGHFPVRWSKRLNWGLGYPYFNFNYPLTYYLTYLMSKLGFDLLTAFKTILLLSFPLSGFFAFLWLKQNFSKTAAFVGGLFYTLMPYHFVNVYVRGNLAETLALTIVPLNLYLINCLNRKPNLNRAILLSFSLASLILIHNISALLFLPVILIYGLLLNLSKKYWKLLIMAFILPLFIANFFWLPALFDKQFIIIDQKFPLYYSQHFPKFTDLVYSPWGYGGSKVGPGQMSVQIGLLHLLIFICSVFVLIFSFKKLRQKKMALFFLSLSFLAFFMMLDFSKPVWEALKPIWYLQFPWRLLSILVLTISFLASFALSFIVKIIPKKAKFLIVVFLVLGLLFVNRNHWKVNQYYQLPDYWFQDAPYGSTTTVDGEHTPKWQSEDMPSETGRFQVISGEAKVVSSIWKTNYHVFQINAKSQAVVLDRTVYFPGWTVFIDGQKAKIIDQYNSKTKGLIGFEIPAGNHKIEVKLLEPLIHRVANIISLSSLVIIAGLLIKSIVLK